MSSPLSTNLEAILDRFDAAWNEPTPPCIEEYAMEAGPGQRLTLLMELVRIDLERRLAAGEKVRLEERYFPRFPELFAELPAIVTLVKYEYAIRRRNEPELMPREYLERFPQCRTELLGQLPTLDECCDGQRQQQTVDAPTGLDLRGYELIETLGKGGMGEVHRCVDPALGRDLAIKVMKANIRGLAEAERRFLREARITGSLQHPGIVPIHNLGRLSDGRMHYTMRLVRGRTFADILKEEAGEPERLPYLLSIFEKICQAAAYAHSKHVIHRDLKPHNVMVGKFGEVQVMDWGLAKLLTPGERGCVSAPREEDTAGTRIVTEADTPAGLSQMGSGMGTPSYMPPEQALGEWDTVDERADVFALGSILCEILTGEPAYRGTDGEEVYRRAKRGDMAEAMQFLQQCGADALLTALCRECLSPNREERPRNADAVAKRVGEYQKEVQERLRQAELERVAAETRAREEQARALVEQERAQEALVRVKAERRAKRRTLALAAAILLLAAGGGVGFWWQQQQRQQADKAVGYGLAQAELLADQARADPLQTDKYRQAFELAQGAAQLAKTASADTRQKAEDLAARLGQEKEAAQKDAELLIALLDVREPHEGPKYQSNAQGMITAMAEPTADEQFAAAFRRWGLDVDGVSAAEAATLLKARPPMVVTEISAALDEWAFERRRQGKAKATRQRLLELAVLLDDDPGSKRRELRRITARGRLPLERVLGVLSAALRPGPISLEVPLGPDSARLRQLAEQTDAAHEPILGLLTLVRALGVAGEETRAEQLLRATIAARPGEVVLHHTLGQLLESQQPPRWAEAVECYGAARTLRPDLGVNLATALLNSGRESEGLALLARLAAKSPKNPFLHFKQARALYDKGSLDEAMAEFREAIALDPKYAAAHNSLGNALHAKRRLDEALDEYRQAIALDPEEALPHYNRGIVLYEKRRLDEAMSAWRQAIALDSKYAPAHNNLGVALKYKGRLDESLAECRLALALDPKYAPAHFNLALALHSKGQLDQALDAYRQAIALNLKLPRVYSGLGLALHTKGRWDEAIAAYRQAIVVDRSYAPAYYNLGIALFDKERLDEALAAYRRAVDLDPNFAKAHNNLGRILMIKGQLDAAKAEFRLVIRLEPDESAAHCNLGLALRMQGRFDEALVSLRRGHELEAKQPGRRSRSAQWIQGVERMIVLDKKLPTILSGEERPADPSEAVALAQMCQQPYKKHYAASARLFADAFAAEPRLAPQSRYNAACSAALAAAGQGEDARRLPDKSVTMFRRWALAWLRDDLSGYAKLVAQSNPAASKAIQQQMAHWRSDADLASVRDPSALKRLPDSECAAWQALWRDVDELAKRTEKADEIKAAPTRPKS